MARRAEILAIGDEITHGQIRDTNSLYIAAFLERHGVDVARFTVVSDDPADLQSAIREVCARADLVIATGGLGPTDDDRTREAVAAVAGGGVVLNEPIWESIQARFRSLGRTLSPTNRRQAELPAGAVALENEWGTAPGFRLRIDRADFFVFPGVPRELYPMLDRHLEPFLLGLDGAQPMAFGRLHVVGPPESVLGETLATFMQPGANPRVGITAQMGLMSVRVAASGASQAEADQLCATCLAAMRPLLGEDLVAEGLADLNDHVVRRLLAAGKTIAVAESCTGGLVAELLTDVPGASAVFAGGYVAYTAARKTADVGVDPALIERYGEVSDEVAAALAEGARTRIGASIGIGISGIAGPSGGTDAKPVGHVCFGLSTADGTRAWTRRLPPIDRGFIRHRAALEVFTAVIRELARR